MKTKHIFFLAALLLGIQPLRGSSSLDGGEQQRRQSTTAPVPSHDLGEGGPSAGIALPAAPAAGDAQEPHSQMGTIKGSISGASDDALGTATGRPSSERNQGRKMDGLQKQNGKRPSLGATKTLQAQDPPKPSQVFGIISLSAGAVAVLALAFAAISWVMVPILLLATPTAIIFGVIGMGKNRRGRGLAIAGFVLGLLCIFLSLLLLIIVASLFFA